MTYKKIIEAYPMLQKMVKMELPVKVSYQLYKACKKIEEEKNFFVTEEKKLIDKYSGQVNEQGKISFDKDDNKIKFIQEYEELNNLEIKELTDTLPIKIKLDELNIKLSVVELALLDQIIDFE